MKIRWLIPIVLLSLLLVVQVVSAGSVTGTVTADPLTFRAAPMTTAVSLGTLPKTTVVEVVGKSEDGLWLSVKYGGQSGWLKAQFVTLSAGAISDLSVVPFVKVETPAMGPSSPSTPTLTITPTNAIADLNAALDELDATINPPPAAAGTRALSAPTATDINAKIAVVRAAAAKFMAEATKAFSAIPRFVVPVGAGELPRTFLTKAPEVARGQSWVILQPATGVTTTTVSATGPKITITVGSLVNSFRMAEGAQTKWDAALAKNELRLELLTDTGVVTSTANIMNGVVTYDLSTKKAPLFWFQVSGSDGSVLGYSALDKYQLAGGVEFVKGGRAGYGALQFTTDKSIKPADAQPTMVSQPAPGNVRADGSLEIRDMSLAFRLIGGQEAKFNPATNTIVLMSSKRGAVGTPEKGELWYWQLRAGDEVIGFSALDLFSYDNNVEFITGKVPEGDAGYGALRFKPAPAAG